MSKELSIEECKKQIADLQGKIEDKTGGGDDENKDKDKLLADLASQKKDIQPAQVKLAQRRMLKGHFGTATTTNHYFPSPPFPSGSNSRCALSHFFRQNLRHALG
jgi:hypothetical protein